MKERENCLTHNRRSLALFFRRNVFYLRWLIHDFFSSLWVSVNHLNLSIFRNVSVLQVFIHQYIAHLTFIESINFEFFLFLLASDLILDLKNIFFSSFFYISIIIYGSMCFMIEIFSFRFFHIIIILVKHFFVLGKCKWSSSSSL